MTDPRAHELSARLQAVCLARSEVDHARHATPPRGLASAVAEQRLLLAALEQYEDALIHHGNPTPYRMRDELALYRGMFNIRRQQ
jgi:hypothetical protein